MTSIKCRCPFLSPHRQRTASSCFRSCRRLRSCRQYSQASQEIPPDCANYPDSAGMCCTYTRHARPPLLLRPRRQNLIESSGLRPAGTISDRLAPEIELDLARPWGREPCDGNHHRKQSLSGLIYGPRKLLPS